MKSTKKEIVINVPKPSQNPDLQTEVRSEKIKVAIRVRPMLKNEIGKENVCHVSKNVKLELCNIFRGNK